MRHAVHRPRQLRVLRRPTGWGAVRESIHEPAVRGTPPQHAPLVGEHPMIDVLPGTDRRLTDLYIHLPFPLHPPHPLSLPPPPASPPFTSTSLPGSIVTIRSGCRHCAPTSAS